MTSAHRDSFVTVVPHKSLDRTKTRLRSVLSNEARIELSLRMLRHVLQVCTELQDSEWLFLCAPAELAPLGEQYGATLLEGGEKGMRRDVTVATEDWRIMGRAAMLFVSADLPLLTVDDLVALVEPWREGADIVLAPDHRERGTNAMMVNEPERFAYAFGEVLGPGSFHTHRDQAIGHDLKIIEVRRPGLQLDIDLPDDVMELCRQAPDNPLAQYARGRFQEHFRFE